MRKEILGSGGGWVNEILNGSKGKMPPLRGEVITTSPGVVMNGLYLRSYGDTGKVTFSFIVAAVLSHVCKSSSDILGVIFGLHPANALMTAMHISQ
jgi:hypothetical protein